MEQWRAVRNYEGLYEVSNEGRVRSAIVRGKNRVPAHTIKKPSIHKKTGYLYLALTDHHRNEKKHYLHCLVLEAFCPRENMADLEVNHIDRIKTNCALSNLEWMTHKENIHHARMLGAWAANQPRGTKAGRAKLTDETVREIRRLWKSGKQQIEIASLFSVSQVAISNVVRRKTWAHVE